MLAFAHMVDFFADEFSSLRRRRLPFAPVSRDRFLGALLGHDAPSSVAFEELDRALMTLGGSPRLERAEIAPPASFGILFS
jgi:hypothetical protein